MITPMRSTPTFLPLLALAVLLLVSATPAAAQSSDAALSGLTVTGSSDGTSYNAVTLSPAFAAGTGSYTAVVADTVTTVKVTPTASHANATVRVGVGTDLTVVASGSASEAISLSAGVNVIKVEVTAQDGTAVKTYTVTVATTYAQLAEFITNQSVEAEIAAADDCSTGITKQEMIDAISEYLFGDGSMTKADIIKIINCYLFGPPPPSPSIAISSLRGLMGVGYRDTFTVSASNLSSSSSYNILVEAERGIGFDSECLDRDSNYTVPNSAESATTSAILYACDAGSHEVRAKIRRGTTVDHEVSQTVTVTSDASIGVGGLPSVMEIGATETFTVDAVNLDASVRYTITIEAGTGLAFDAACGGSAYSHAVPSRSTSVSKQPTARACSAGQHTVNIKLMNGTVEVASASQQVNVKPPAPEGLRLNGHSPTAGQRQFTAEWDEATGAQSYKIRHAVECSTQSSCTPPSRHSWSPEISSSDEETTVSGLSSDSLYRVQVKSVGAGGAESDWSDYAVVYPTRDQPSATTTVASGHLTSFWPTHSFSYTICRNTWPSTGSTDQKAKWTGAVERSIDAWRDAVKWNIGTSASPRNIIAFSGTTSDSCPREGQTGYLSESDAEVRRAETEDGFEDYCGEDVRIGTTTYITLACVEPPLPVAGALGRRARGDLMFRHDGSYWSTSIIPQNDVCWRLGQLAAHEFGHVLGLGHSDYNGSQMYRGGSSSSECKPHPYDVAALMAIYQSHTP